MIVSATNDDDEPRLSPSDSPRSTNEMTSSFPLVDELRSIEKNLQKLAEHLDQRSRHLMQTGLPNSHDQLRRCYDEHKVRSHRREKTDRGKQQDEIYFGKEDKNKTISLYPDRLPCKRRNSPCD